MSALNLGLLAGGSLLSGLGGIIGGNSQRRQQETQTQWGRSQVLDQQSRLADALFGPSWRQYRVDSDLAAQEAMAGRPGAFAKLKMSPELNRQLTGLNQGSLLDRMEQLQRQFASQGRSQMGAYNAETGRLANQANGLGLMAGMWGQGRDAIIDQDAKRALTSANQAAQARLAASGLGGSTLTTQAMAGNAERINQNVNRAKQDVSEGRIDRQLGAGNTALNLASQRASGRVGLQNIFNERNLGLAMRPVDSRLSLLTGGGLNPYSAGNIPNYQPAQSGIGSAIGSIGNTAAGLGSMLFTRDLLGGGQRKPNWDSLWSGLSGLTY